MLPLIFFLLVLSVLVLIHELGHFLAARFFGIKADEFGYGFPPRLIGIVRDGNKWKIVRRNDETQYKNTIWSLNWLPLGGFVRIKGEQPDDEFKDKDSFQTKPIWQRVIVLAAGVTMNWLLAFVLFVGIFIAGAPTLLEDLPEGAIVADRGVRVLNVLPESPALAAGLLPGDTIIKVADTDASSYSTVQQTILDQSDKNFVMQISRNGNPMSLDLKPTYIKEIDRFGIGISLGDVGTVKLPWYRAIYEAGRATYSYTIQIIVGFGTMIRDLLFLRGVQQDISGPVGIAVMTGQIAEQGIIPLLQFAAILSINLAVINFLPIPALDGGRVLFLVIEKIRRRALRPKLEAIIHQVAFLSLIVLILLVTIRDLGRYGGVIIGGLKGLVGM